MHSSTANRGTLIGHVVGVQSARLLIRLAPTSTGLVMVGGESYRVGQIGSFVRVTVGYSDLYAVVVAVGGDLHTTDELPLPHVATTTASSTAVWHLTAVLFGEASGGHFERGISQYPTVGEEVHLSTAYDQQVIYSRDLGRDDLELGKIAGSQSIPARLVLSSLLTRHSCVVGSTGAGKSNVVAVALEELSDYPAARVLVIDPHGEYSAVATGKSITLTPGGTKGGAGSRELHVPYWALPATELIELGFGPVTATFGEYLRERIRELRLEAARLMGDPPPDESVTADSPIPFSIRRLWYELEVDERATFKEANKQDNTTRTKLISRGSAATLEPPRYPPATSVNSAPYHNRARRNVSKQLDLLRTRLLDDKYKFLFDPAHPSTPDEAGRVKADLDDVIAEWVGHDQPITVVDVSSIPAEALPLVVGTMLRIVYDALFWAQDLEVGGRKQPLLVVLDEAHLFLAGEEGSLAHSVLTRIAKEGRKYGVGLMLVSQRPSDIDSALLSQCGTMIALRVTNGQDRAAVSSAVPDDLGSLVATLPSLRTGEALVLGEALQVPSRVRVRLARTKPAGGDPSLPTAWLGHRPSPSGYTQAIKNWRVRSS